MNRATLLRRAIILFATLLFALVSAPAQSEGPDGHFYKVILEPHLLWEEARIKAAESTLNGLHGYLATINSLQEDQFIDSLRRQAGSNVVVWIGGSQQTDATSPFDGWFWVNGEGPISTANTGESYGNWFPGEPDDTGGLNPGRFLALRGSNVFGWSSEPDDRHIDGYVIEYSGAGAENRVSTVCVDPIAIEDALQENRPNVATFEFRREGNLSLDLPVFYSIHGTAINGDDYDEISKSILIPAGESAVRLNIVPRVDALAVVERMETVGIRVEPSLILTPAAAYEIDPDFREAGAVIYETEAPPSGALELVLPRNTTHPLGEPVVFLAALSFSNVVNSVDFYRGDIHRGTSNFLGSAAVVSRTNDLAFYRFVWTNTVASSNFVTALTTHNGSVQFKSLPFRVNVAGTEPPLVKIRSVTPESTNATPAADYAFGHFEITRTGSVAGDLQVHYAINGTATAGVDYETLPSYVVIGAGRTTARIHLAVAADEILEPTEFVTLALVPSTNRVTGSHLYRIDSTNRQANIQIFDQGTGPSPTNIVVSIEATKTHTSEPDWWLDGIPEFGEFTFRRTGPTNEPLRVFMSIGGTAENGIDYVALTNFVDFAAGRTEAKLSVIPIEDGFIDGRDETVVAELTPAPPGSDPYGIDPDGEQATVKIIDTTRPRPTNVLVSIEATRSETSEPLPSGTFAGEFTVRRTGSTTDNLRVYLEYGGTAGLGVDYNAPIVITIPRGLSEMRVPIIAEADDLVEGHETVVAVLKTRPEFSIDANQRSATVTIQDEDSIPSDVVVSVEATRRETSEASSGVFGPEGQFTFRRTGPTNESLRIFVSFEGTALMGHPSLGKDYAPFTNFITFRAGQMETTLGVIAWEDDLVEGDESVVVSLEAPTGSNYRIDTARRSATVVIHDENTPPGNVVVSIEARDSEATEAIGDTVTDRGSFTVHRSGATNSPMAVFLSYSGTATWAGDYGASETILFPAGLSALAIHIGPYADTLTEGDETVIAEVLAPTQAPTYSVNPLANRATVTIHDLNSPDTNLVVSVEATRPSAYEPGGGLIGYDGEFTLRRSGPTNRVFTVQWIFGGTATLGTDYSANTNSVTFQAGQTEVRRVVSPLEDNAVEEDETVTVQLISLSHYTVDPERSHATVAIHDQGPTNVVKVSIEATQSETTEPFPFSNFGQLTVRRMGPTNSPLSVSLNYSGTAAPGLDYMATNRVVVIPAGAVERRLGIIPLSDNLVEGDETVVAEIVPSTDTPSYSIDPQMNRAVVTIHDEDEASTNVVISMEAVSKETTEPPSENAAGVTFILRRTGPTNTPLAIAINYGGTATRGEDYIATNSVLFPAGPREHRFFLYPLADKLVEGDETAILELNRPPTNGPAYAIFPGSNRAVVTIHDHTSTNILPTVSIVRPADGAVFLQDEIVPVVVEASARVGSITNLQLYVNGQLNTWEFGPRLEVRLGGFDLGENTLRASAADNFGNQVTSGPVRILIRHRDAVSFVHRKLPETYSPGVALTVGLRATPPDGTQAYAVEDQPPAGWQVSQISDGGVFDAANQKVKFGPFTDAAGRALTYRLTPPEEANGRYVFAGSSSINGALYPIAGDNSLEVVQMFHPADRDDSFSIVLAEVTAYAAAWKSGETWPAGPAPIPLTYVTSAGSIWKRGEGYRFDPARGPAPHCWISSNTLGATILSAQAASSAERSIPVAIESGIETDIQIAANPPTGAVSYAVEEKPPRGWAVSNISHGGGFDADSGVIRWGVYFDTAPRLLRYTLTPPAGVASLGVFSGELSFDGQLTEIRSASISAVGPAPMQITSVSIGATGFTLHIRGPAGQTAVVESTPDFVNWTEIQSLFIPDGDIEFIVGAQASGRLFYRLRVQ